MAVYIFMLLFLQMVSAVPWSAKIQFNKTTVHMDEILSIPISVSINSTESSRYNLIARSSDTKIATVNREIKLIEGPHEWMGIINVTGVFLGTSKISVSLFENQIEINSQDVFTITVIRKERVIDTIFTASVAILVSILYVNFGCAIDWGTCHRTLKRPVGPLIGSVCQFILMPLLSYGIALLLFPDRPELQIGMFFTGISPSGGASNIWTLLLDGNLNLSVTMTTLCTIASFATMPLWIFTLGRHIFERGELAVPYTKIATFAVGLIVPLTIGYFIQKKLPKFSRIMVRIMKPFSAVLIIFIIIFAIVTNLYLFKLFSWQIIVAGLGLPWLGFISGMLVSLAFKQPLPDVKAIAIETGIQNTGVAIFLLRFSLPQPAADLTTVLPVSTAIMTPLPLLLLYVIKLIHDRKQKTKPKSAASLEKLKDIGEQTRIVQSNRY